MTQKAMAELFDVEQPAIAKHLINIYNEKELDKNSTYSKMELVQKKLHTLISGLSNAGLNSTQTSNADLRMLLDNYLNDGIYIEVSLSKHLYELYKQYEITK